MLACRGSLAPRPRPTARKSPRTRSRTKATSRISVFFWPFLIGRCSGSSEARRDTELPSMMRWARPVGISCRGPFDERRAPTGRPALSYRLIQPRLSMSWCSRAGFFSWFRWPSYTYIRLDLVFTEMYNFFFFSVDFRGIVEWMQDVFMRELVIWINRRNTGDWRVQEISARRSKFNLLCRWANKL